MKFMSVLLVIWLVIGAIAAYQRDYFDSSDTDCAEVGTIALTIAAGALNYLGVNPKISNCTTPEPSR